MLDLSVYADFYSHTVLFLIQSHIPARGVFMATITYDKGLQALGTGLYAYLTPDGSWGLSNAGLVTDNGSSLLIDTLFDVKLTQQMHREMAAADPAAESIDTLVITHGNGDHFYGSELFPGANIIASKACAEEMEESPPEALARFLEMAPSLGPAGDFAVKMFGRFDFTGLAPRPATQTFEGRFDFKVGDKEVRLIEVGPAHTRGDVIVHVPEDKTVFAGDMLFVGGTPILWVGPISNWIKACDLMLSLDVKYFVPGHGPVTDKKGVADVKGYLEFIHAQALKRFEAGMPEPEAVADIDLGPYQSLGDWERIAVNINTLYKEFSGDVSPPEVLSLFTRMAELSLAGRR
jgi:cyclase